jgi:hypothetical protein
MSTQLARVLTAVVLGLTAGLTVRAYAASMTSETAVTTAPMTRPAQPRTLGAGVRGVVVMRTGDWMPPVDRSRAKEIPVSVPLYVFQGKVCVATLQSGADGQFSVLLAAGTYTIAALLGETVETGTVRVPEDQWTELHLHFDVGVTY